MFTSCERLFHWPPKYHPWLFHARCASNQKLVTCLIWKFAAVEAGFCKQCCLLFTFELIFSYFRCSMCSYILLCIFQVCVNAVSCSVCMWSDVYSSVYAYWCVYFLISLLWCVFCPCQGHGLPMEATRRLLRLQLALVELSLAMLEQLCATEKKHALVWDKKTSAEKALEEFMRCTPDHNSSEQVRQWPSSLNLGKSVIWLLIYYNLNQSSLTGWS